MTRAPWAWAAAAGVTLAAGVGCYSPPQYASPYGGYPAYQSQPAYQMAPGGSYVVPGGSLGAPTAVPGSGPTLAPPLNGGSSAPPYNGSNQTFENSSGAPAGPSVPNYDEPKPSDYDNGSFGAPPAGGTTQPPNDGFQPPATNGAAPGGTGSPFMEGTAVPRRLGIEQAARPIDRRDNLAGLDAYKPPGRAASPAGFAASDPDVQPAAFEERPAPVVDFGFDPVTSPAGPQPQADPADEAFGYDRSGYRWLRGVVDYDPNGRNWNIIYGLPPDPHDEFGGSLTLADGAELRDLRNNDVVLVEGRIDPSAGQDVLGKPLYRVTRAELVGRYE
jgi:hypothetical protein